jgi:hypothetical protein
VRVFLFLLHVNKTKVACVLTIQLNLSNPMSHPTESLREIRIIVFNTLFRRFYRCFKTKTATRSDISDDHCHRLEAAYLREKLPRKYTQYLKAYDAYISLSSVIINEQSTKIRAFSDEQLASLTNACHVLFNHFDRNRDSAVGVYQKLFESLEKKRQRKQRSIQERSKKQRMSVEE